MSLGRHDRAGSLLSSVVDDRSLLSSAGGKQNETYETKVKARTRLKHPASSLVQLFLLETHSAVKHVNLSGHSAGHGTIPRSHSLVESIAEVVRISLDPAPGLLKVGGDFPLRRA